MTDYRAFRSILNSDPITRTDVFQYHYDLGRYGGMSEVDARLDFENNFINNPRVLEPLITTYFASNVVGSTSSVVNTSNSTKKMSHNQRKLEKSLLALAGGVVTVGVAQFSDMEASKGILELVGTGAVLGGAVGTVVYGIKKRFEDN